VRQEKALTEEARRSGKRVGRWRGNFPWREHPDLRTGRNSIRRDKKAFREGGVMNEFEGPYTLLVMVGWEV